VSGTSHRRRQGDTPYQRDRRVFSAVQARVDALGSEIANHEARAEHHLDLACWHLAEADDLARTRFDLVAGMARIERRLVKGQAVGARSRSSGRAAA